jgi:hypothetical protein
MVASHFLVPALLSRNMGSILGFRGISELICHVGIAFGEYKLCAPSLDRLCGLRMMTVYRRRLRGTTLKLLWFSTSIDIRLSNRPRAGLLGGYERLVVSRKYFSTSMMLVLVLHKLHVKYMSSMHGNILSHLQRTPLVKVLANAETGSPAALLHEQVPKNDLACLQQ